jgi:hypothetical protein
VTRCRCSLSLVPHFHPTHAPHTPPYFYNPSQSIPTSVVEITCYEYEGINAIKEALRAGAAVGDEKLPIKVCACVCSAATAGWVVPRFPCETAFV